MIQHEMYRHGGRETSRGATTHSVDLTLVTPNDPYRGRTAPLTSKRCILYIYSTNIQVPNILNMVHTLRFFLFKMKFVS